MASEACRLSQDLNLKDHYNGASSVEKDDALKGGFGATKSEVCHMMEHLVLRDESDDSNEEYNKLVEELYGCGYQLAFKYPDDEISSPPPLRYPLYHYSEEEEWEVISDDDDEVEEEMVDEVVVASKNSVELCGN